MDWPLDKDWSCVICGARALTWGFVYGECRCDSCHTTYMMRDYRAEFQPRVTRRVTRPISLIKEGWLEPAREAWKIYSKPLDELTEDEWTEAGAPKGGQDE